MKRLLRVFFRLLYHEFSWSYDLVANLVSFGRWQEWTRSIMPYLADGPILELGTGSGHLQLSLNQTGRTVFGLDLSPQMLRITRQRLSADGFTPKLARGTGRLLPFATGTFQNVTATFPTEYLFQPETLAEIARVLAPGGRLIVLPMVFITGRSLLQRMVAWLYRVTGQSAQQEAVFKQDPFMVFKTAGFAITQHLIEEQGVSLLVIEALLPEPNRA